MKIKFTAVFMAFVVLAGCTSTTDSEQSSSAKATNKIQVSEVIIDKEITELASKTKFSAQELKDAAATLGYRCTIKERTSSRIKRKVCSTEQQRYLRQEAARRYVKTQMDNANSAHSASLTGLGF